MSKLDDVPYWNLTVTVLQAKLHQSYDYWSESDCYVILRLPTSSAFSHRTKTVSNSNSPVWNETFHFRIQSHIKNVLEIEMYDEDTMNRDDRCAYILFDTKNLVLGQQKTEVFLLDNKAKDELWIDFKLEESQDQPGKYWTNGVLMAPPLTVLEIFPKPSDTEIETRVMKLKGAYKEEGVLSPELIQPLCYYINKDLETELSLEDHKKVKLVPEDLKSKEEIKLPVREDFIHLRLKTEEWSDRKPSVRLDFDIPSEEKQFLEKRKVVVGRALQKLLQLSSPPDTEKVPLVGVVCSGGGTRAMTGTFGSLRGLQTLGILDAVSYITGVSGSTWAMSLLYQDSQWSKGDITAVTGPVKTEMIQRHKDILSPEKISYYRKEMKQKEKEGHLVSYVDMWGLVIEHLIYGKKWESTLSDQMGAVSEGQNPLPIYTAVNSKRSQRSNITESEWCEFSPYEVGLLKYGAFVPTKHFGCEFFLGRQLNSIQENRLPFLIGIWSSAFSVSLTDVWQHVTGSKPTWIASEVTSTEKEEDSPAVLDSTLILPGSTVAKKISDFLTERPVSCEMYNFMRGLSLHCKYCEAKGFFVEEETHPDAFPNQLTPADPTLNLVDSGLTCNLAFSPLLRANRHMDIIFSLNYSWDSDQFQVLKKTQQYNSDRKIPFPHIDFSRVEKEPLKEVYVFEDENNPKAPIVVHFPMVNLSFREFKAPGVKREGKDELIQGNVDVSTKDSPYRTRNLAYKPEDFQKLMDLTYYNVLNNRDILLSAVRKALQRT